MADEIVPAPAPIRSDDQILPFVAWVPIEKSNYVLDLQKKQKNLIFQISFLSPSSGDEIMDFVNELGYPEARLLEFVQAIQTFLTDKANLGSPTKKARNDKAHVIPYCRFTKLLSITMGRIHNIHHRSASPFHLAEKDLRLGNRKFVSKGEVDEVFGMPIPNELILNNIRNAPLLQCILGMDRKALI
ncbi:hypothetical protein Tco_0996597 [Tanacetum coccineum]